MKAESPARIALAVLACAAALAFSLLGCSGFEQEDSLAAPEAAPIPVNALEQAEIVRVIDGDTLSVRLSDGSEERVRLIGTDAPESKSPDEDENCPEGEQAEANLRGTLPKGERVWMSKDTSERDRYGRLLRYVWLEEPASEMASSQEFCSKCLNARLVIGGWAQPKRYPPDTAAADLLEALGDSSAAQGLGVSAKWSGAQP